jgi:hypothetical protein
VALVRKRTIQTERPPLVSEVSANSCWMRVSRGQRNGLIFATLMVNDFANTLYIKLIFTFVSSLIGLTVCNYCCSKVKREHITSCHFIGVLNVMGQQQVTLLLFVLGSVVQDEGCGRHDVTTLCLLLRPDCWPPSPSHCPLDRRRPSPFLLQLCLHLTFFSSLP